MPRLLLTAGPTREPIDAVRYIGNRSSGRMGLAIADAANEAGWTVTLLLGPGIDPPRGTINTLGFETTEDLAQLLETHWPDHDVLIMAAAVADERIHGAPAPGKLVRGTERTMALEPTPDLLASLSGVTRPDQYRVGFALEPAEHLLERARMKMDRKGVNALVANPLETMEATSITAHLLLPGGETITAPEGLDKPTFARWLLDQITPRLHTTS